MKPLSATSLLGPLLGPGGAFMSDGMAGVANAACQEGTIYTVSELQPIHHQAAVIYRDR